MRAATNTTNDNTDDLDTMTDAAAKLALAIAQYGNGAGLPNDHPWHQLKSLHGEMTTAIATERKRRKDAGKEVVEGSADALGPHMGRGARSEPFDGGGDDVTKAYEDVLDCEAELIKAQTGLTIEKAYVAALDKRRDVVRKLRPSPVAETSGQQKAWALLEAAADRLIAKSAKPISREGAIDRILKNFPDLATAYYKLAGDPSGGATPDAPRASVGQAAAWTAIEEAADNLVAKSAAPMTREHAIDRVLKTRLDLSRAYYYDGIYPLTDRVR